MNQVATLEVREAKVVINENDLVDALAVQLAPGALRIGENRGERHASNRVIVRLDDQEFEYAIRNIITMYHELSGVILCHATWMDVEEPVGSYHFVFFRRIMVAGVATYKINQHVAHMHADYGVAESHDTTLELMRLLYTD